MDPHRPYVGSIDVRRFSLDLCDPASFVDVLLRMLEPWAVLARSAIASTLRHIKLDNGQSSAFLATAHEVVKSIRKRGRQPSLLADNNVRMRRVSRSDA